MIKVIGFYNDERYQVMVTCDEAGCEGLQPCIYQAGNSRWDSQGYIERTSPKFIPENVSALKDIKRYCESTCKEVADQQGWTVGEIVHDPEGKHMEGIWLDHAMDLDEAMHLLGQPELPEPYWPNA